MELCTFQIEQVGQFLGYSTADSWANVGQNQLCNNQNIAKYVLFSRPCYSLFGRVVELVLVGPGEALLHPSVRPQPLHAGEQLLREGLRVLHAGHHVHHHLGVALQTNKQSEKGAFSTEQPDRRSQRAKIESLAVTTSSKIKLAMLEVQSGKNRLPNLIMASSSEPILRFNDSGDITQIRQGFFCK